MNFINMSWRPWICGLFVLWSVDWVRAEGPSTWRDIVLAPGRAVHRAVAKLGSAWEWERLQRENTAIEPFVHGHVPLNPGASGSWSASQQALRLEAAGEYCRAKKVDFEAALPGVYQSEKVIFAGGVPLDDPQRWVILYRSCFTRERHILLTLNLLTLAPQGKHPPLRTLDEKFFRRVDVYSVAAKGLSDSATVWRGRGNNGGREIAFEVLEQWRPLADDSWFTQIVARYRVRDGKIEREWKREMELDRVNFVYDLAFTPVRKEAPRLGLTEGK